MEAANTGDTPELGRKWNHYHSAASPSPVHPEPNQTASGPSLSMGLSAARKKLNDTQNYEKFQQNYLNIFSKIEKSNHVKFFKKENNSQIELSSSQRSSS